MDYEARIIQIDDKEYLEVRGVNFGYSNGSRLLIKYKDIPYIIVHVKGGSDWSGRGETSYYASQYYLLKKTNIKHSNGVDVKFENIKEIDVGRKWKQSLNYLINLIGELKNG